MTREQVIAALCAQEPEFKSAGVVSMSLFGSTARNEPEAADVDIAVRLADNFSEGGFDYFYQLEELQKRLSRILGAAVDVVPEPVRKERFQHAIDRDRALAF